MFDLRNVWVRRVVAYATGVAWVLVAQLWILVATGRPVGGDWARALAVSVLILAGIGTVVLAIAQVARMALDTIMPVVDAIKVGYEIGRSDGEAEGPLGPTVVNLVGQRRPESPIRAT